MIQFPYALAAIDIDDTLVDRNKRMSPENHAAIRQLQELGCRIVLATGRRHANALATARDLDLEDYVISTQGARVEHTATGHVLYTSRLAPEITKRLVSEGLDRGHTVLLWREEAVYAQAETPWLNHYYEETEDGPVTIADLLTLADEPAEKVVWLAERETINSAHIAAEIRHGDDAVITVTTDFSLEFSAPGAEKDKGVAAVARHYGIPRESVLAFGDSNNDTAMLAWAGLGVAMAHGRPGAHAAADLVTPAGPPESALARGIEVVMRQLAVQHSA